jgi:hypothetical protein
LGSPSRSAELIIDPAAPSQTESMLETPASPNFFSASAAEQTRALVEHVAATKACDPGRFRGGGLQNNPELGEHWGRRQMWDGRC